MLKAHFDLRIQIQWQFTAEDLSAQQIIPFNTISYSITGGGSRSLGSRGDEATFKMTEQTHDTSVG